MRVIVTGAAGGIGRHILNYFGKDFKIVGFDTVQGPEMEHVEWVIGDILNVDRLTQAARGCDAMIHLAGIPIYNPDRDLDIGRVNIYGMQCAVEAAARAGVKRFAYASSICATSFIFWQERRTPKYFPVDEEYFDMPDDIYGLSKFFNERIAWAYQRRYGIETVGLRMATVWLPDHEPTDQLLRDLLKPEHDDNLKFRDLRWQYLDVRDAAQAFYLAVTHPKAVGIFNVGAADSPGGDWRLWVQELYPDVPVLRQPGEYLADLTLPLWSIRKLSQEAGYQPKHSWQEYPVFVEELEKYKERVGAK